MKKYLILLFLLTFSLTSSGQTFYSFKLIKGKKTITVDTSALVEINLFHRVDKNDSILRQVSGTFSKITQDSISLKLYSIKDKKLRTVNFSYPDLPTKNYSISNIQEIITVNRKLEKTMAGLALTSLISGLVVSPLVSLKDGKMNWSQVGKISGISAGGFCLSLIVSGTCWDRHHRLKQTTKKKSIWILQR